MLNILISHKVEHNFNKKVYLLNDIYEPYKDELIAWGVIPLNGNLKLLKK